MTARHNQETRVRTTWRCYAAYPPHRHL